MKLFGRSKDIAACPQNDDVATIRNKCSELEQHIAAAETKLRRASLAAALGDDAEALEAGRQLQALRDRRELLSLALAEAERIEAERQAALHAREWQARKRSLAQKTGQLERDAGEISRLTEALHNARNRMTDTGQGIVALLPQSLRSNARPYPAMLATRTLRELCDLERWRLDQDAPKPTLRLAEYWPNFQERATGWITPIGELVGQICASLKGEFDKSEPQAAAVQAEAERAVKLHDEADQAEQEGAPDA